jgi:hypothetical protein
LGVIATYTSQNNANLADGSAQLHFLQCAALTAALAILPSIAYAGCRESGSTLCSKTFYGEGICDGSDQLVVLKADGLPSVAIVKPWEPEPISIVGVEITFIKPPRHLTYAYAGNGATPNQMLFMGQGQAHARVFYPHGLGFKLPGAGAPGHIDLHVSCPPPESPPPVPGRPPKQTFWQRLSGAAPLASPAPPIPVEPPPDIYRVFCTFYYTMSASPIGR